MKILMLCDFPLSSSEIDGGVSAAAYNLVHALLEHTDCSIVVAGFWKEYRETSPWFIDQGRLKVVRCPPPAGFAHLRNFRRERRMMSKIIEDEKPDVIHAQGEGIYASVAVNSGIPNVYTIHGVALRELNMGRKEFGLARYVLRSSLIKRHHRRATNIVAINQYTRDAIADLHEARVWTIPNAVDDGFFDLYRPEDRAAGRLLQVGGVRARKDVPTLLRAVATLRQRGLAVTLDIVGPTDESLDEVRSIMSAQDLEGAVAIRGLVPASLLNDLYASADIFVLSSIEESSPISIVQAMAAGLPIVSTDVGGIREMVEEGGNCFLVEPGKSEDLARRLESLIADRSLRRSFALKSRQIAEADWSARSVALQTLKMYKEVAMR